MRSSDQNSVLVIETVSILEILQQMHFYKMQQLLLVQLADSFPIPYQILAIHARILLAVLTYTCSSNLSFTS